LLIWMSVTDIAAKTDGAAKSVALLCLASAALILARADGFLIPALAVVYLVYACRYKTSAVVFGSVVLTTGGNFFWRRAYYGEWLPNTYHAKVNGTVAQRISSAMSAAFQQDGFIPYGFGLPQFVQNAIWLPIVLVGFTAASGLWPKFTNPARRADRIPFELALLVCWVSYWIWIGGDYLGDRHLILFWPIGIYRNDDPCVRPCDGV